MTCLSKNRNYTLDSKGDYEKTTYVRKIGTSL